MVSDYNLNINNDLIVLFIYYEVRYLSYVNKLYIIVKKYIVNFFGIIFYKYKFILI